MAFQQQTFAPQPSFASKYGHCESYFVESHDDDDGMYARAAAERERQRGLSKLKQKELAEEISRITADEYQNDILSHMERMENETMPDIHSIEIQTEIQWFMRPYLLDFLLEAHHAFQLLPETLHLAVNILDRYCSRRVVYKRHYQLVGCAALLIAAKYGDRKERVPTIRELKSMCCSLYEDDMFTQMEWHVLQTLNWMIGHSTVTSFLQLALTEMAPDAELEHMTWFVLEMALYSKEFIPVRPSVMSRAALSLAGAILNRPQPSFELWAAQYDPHVVISLSNHLHTPSQALVRKFASPHYSGVSSTLEAFLARQAAIAAAARVHTPTLELQHNDMEIDAHAQHQHHQQQHAPMNQQLLTPQTPQKPMVGGYAPFALPIGVLTPPITPDKDFNPAAAVVAGLPPYHPQQQQTGMMVPQQHPHPSHGTPTPPPQPAVVQQQHFVHAMTQHHHQQAHPQQLSHPHQSYLSHPQYWTAA